MSRILYPNFNEWSFLSSSMIVEIDKGGPRGRIVDDVITGPQGIATSPSQ